MTRIRRLLASVVAGATALVLAACASIPVSGPVESGRPIEEDRAQGVRYYPAPPFDGASREEVVQGFLDAGTGAQNDFAVAREYLDSEIAAEWNPTGQVLIIEGQVAMKTETDRVVSVSVQVRGRVDARGNYRESVAPTPETLRFEVDQIDGEWRITDAPNTIVLVRQYFNDLFKARTLYFFGSELRYLTPDVRWFLANGDAASRSVRELLVGPGEWLAVGGAVRSAFPDGVALRQPVRVEGGTAIVDLTDAASTASPDALRLMRLQLEETLLPITDATSVEVRVNEAKLDVSMPPADEVVRAPDVNSSPMVSQRGSIGYLTGGELSLPSGTEQVVAAVDRLQPIRGAISASRGTIVLLNSEGTWSMAFDDQYPTLVDDRPGQVEPALDNWDWVWTQSTAEPGLYVSRVSAYGLTEVPLPAEIREDFVSHQVSRDGTRLAVIYRSEGRIKLAVMAVVRDATRPVALGPPLIVDMPGTTAIDVAWADSNTVAMLVGGDDGSVDVRVYRVGGELTTLGPIQDAMQVAGSNTLAGMRVVDRNGTLYAPRGSGWRSSDAVITFLFAQV